MSRVDGHNPLKASALSRKRDAMREESGGKVQFSELTIEEVRTDAVNFGLVTEVLSQMNGGKEASIFLAHWKGHPIVLKAYRLWKTSHRMSKSKGHITTGGKRTHVITSMMEEIAVHEHSLLYKCFKAGVHVPTPIGRVGYYLTMRFIGDGWEPAPQLREVELENPEIVLDQIFDDYFLMYGTAHYTHGDLSAYNILWWQNRPWIIDVPQGEKVGPWADMKKVELILLRDIENVLKYFEQYEIYRDPHSILEEFLAGYIPNNQRNYRELQRDGVELL